MNIHFPFLGHNHADVSKRWRELSGAGDWAGLLDPLDDDLRRYIIHYGERAQATYDAFDRQKESKYAGSCRFSKRDLFSQVSLEKGRPYKYEVTRFFYATSGIELPDSIILKSLSREAWSKESNWMGYVAVSDDATSALLGRRDILVAWRGSVRGLEWVNDLQFLLVPAKGILGNEEDNPMVHQGWYSVYTSDDHKSPFNKKSARIQVLSEIQRLVEQYKDEEVSITVTGHSLGAALATLNAVDIVANGVNKPSNGKPCPVTVFVFACPRVGDSSFKKVYTKYSDQVKILRVKNSHDIIPNYPIIPYEDVGTELPIDTTKSKYLKSPGNFSTWHNMEAHLHGLAGTRVRGGEFQLAVERDVALVNKSGDFVKDELLVPPAWWVLKNRGMVQQDDGSWKLMDRDMNNDDFF
ncbi:hypothetical protein V2J09_019505 [Rumex salicifolius]